ncbi:MAG: DUF2568 domain-containing protein [Paracoccaceae bacterium]
MLIALNHTLALALEIALVIGVFRFGYGLSDHAVLKWVLASALTGCVVGLWAVLAAPKSRSRLDGAALAGFKAAMYAIGAGAVFVAFGPWPALAFAALAALHMALATSLGIL